VSVVYQYVSSLNVYSNGKREFECEWRKSKDWKELVGRLVVLYGCGNVWKSQKRRRLQFTKNEAEWNLGLRKDQTGDSRQLYSSRCGAAKLTNSRALTTFVDFQNLGKWRKFPVTR